MGFDNIKPHEIRAEKMQIFLREYTVRERITKNTSFLKSNKKFLREYGIESDQLS